MLLIDLVLVFCSKFRKRHNSNSTTCDVELPDAHDATITKEMQVSDPIATKFIRKKKKISTITLNQ